MSSTVKLAAAAIAIALTAALVGIVAFDRGRADPREHSFRYALSLQSPAPVASGSVRGLSVQTQRTRYRVRLAPNSVVELGPRPSCHYLTWRTIRTGSDAR